MWNFPFPRRKNRFLVEADVGPLHLANSGRMEELLRPGALGFYHPHPKTVGRLYLVEREGVLVGVDAHLPSHLLSLLLWVRTWEAWAKEAPPLGIDLYHPMQA